MGDLTRVSIHRSRVGTLIEAAISRSAITLLVAPPGYGKTTALRAAIGVRPGHAWIVLPVEAKLEDLVRLLTSATVPEHRDALAGLFDGSGRPKDLERIVEWMARRLRLFTGTIVIDDLHRCALDPQALLFLGRVIELTSSYVRWIAASREVPALPIGTWVARGLMTLPITDDDLAFDVAEATALAHALGLETEREVIRAIVDDAHGWPMAVHLALQLWERTRSIGPLHVRTRDVLFSQIETELWPHIETDVRTIIFACALLPQTSSAVLEAAGFAQAEAVLERAHNLVPFVQRTPGGDYALHDLFAEFVQKLMRRDPAALAALRERLITGLLAVGRPADALGVGVAGRDAPRVLAVLADAGLPLLDAGHRSVVGTALTFLGEQGYRNDPAVAALRGVLSYADGNTSNAEALLSYAYTSGVPPAMRTETARRLATSLLNRGEGARAVELLEPIVRDNALSASDRVELLASFAGALVTSGRPDDALRIIEEIVDTIESAAPEGRVRALQRLGFTTYYLGDLERARAFSRDAAQLATDMGMWYYAALAHGVLYGVTSLTERDSTIALGHARLTYAAGERAGDAGLAAHGLRAEYVLHAYRGDQLAFDAVEARLSRYHDVRTFRTSFPARNARALAEAIRGRTRIAISTLTVIDLRELSGAERALRDAMLALFLFLADRRNESIALLKSPLLLEAPGDFVSRRYVNLARVTRGLALWCHDRTAQARRVLRFDEHAVAENDRVLLDCITNLCATPRHLSTPSMARDVLATLQLYGWGGYGRLIDTILGRIEPTTLLTPAEIKTLRAFQHGANTQQVAGNLGKSPHTIEAQLKSAYKKIGCVSRAEALVYARSRGWLDDGRSGIPESC